MKKIIVLMYHSIYKTDSEFDKIPDSDKPYSLHCDDFESHIDFFIKNKMNVLNPLYIKNDDSYNEGFNVLITFDDGHEGFYKYAYPKLLKSGLSAIFFVTTDFIGNKPDFCTWSELKEMSDNGMSVQSHGKTHGFLEDMKLKECENELMVSRDIIKDKVGAEVFSISFPGGRYNKATINVAKKLGYTHFYTSKECFNDLGVFLMGGCISRFAIRKGMNDKALCNFLWPKLSIKIKRIIYSSLKSVAKFILGNNLYHSVYKFLSRWL